jgi:HEAT repeat protein
MSFLQRIIGPPTAEDLEENQDVEGLIAALDRSITECQAAVEALGQLGDEGATEPLVAVLRGNDMRKSAARALGQIGAAQAVGPLISALDDIPQVAAEALAEIGAPSVEPLVSALQTRDLKVRWAVAGTLAEIGAPAVKSLIGLLEDSRKDLHPAAAWALGQTGDTRGIAPLIAVLTHEESDVRRIAAQELGRLGDRRAVGPLISALNDEDQQVREVVAEALESITGQAFDENIGDWQSWWSKQPHPSTRR